MKQLAMRLRQFGVCVDPSTERLDQDLPFPDLGANANLEAIQGYDSDYEPPPGAVSQLISPTDRRGKAKKRTRKTTYPRHPSSEVSGTDSDPDSHLARRVPRSQAARGGERKRSGSPKRKSKTAGRRRWVCFRRPIGLWRCWRCNRSTIPKFRYAADETNRVPHHAHRAKMSERLAATVGPVIAPSDSGVAHHSGEPFDSDGNPPRWASTIEWLIYGGTNIVFSSESGRREHETKQQESVELTTEDEDIQQDSVTDSHVSGTISRLLGETPLESSAGAARDRDDTLFRQVERSLAFEGQLEDRDIDQLFLVGRAFGLGLDAVPPPSRNFRVRASATAPVSGGLEGGQKKRKRQQPVVVDTDEDGEDDNNDADDGSDGPATKARKVTAR